MISPDLRFEGFDQVSWTNLISLFAPGVVDRIEADAAESDDPAVEPGAPGRPTGTLFVVTDDKGGVLKAHHTARGRVVGLAYESAADLPRLCDEYAARRAVVLREGVIEELGERLALRLSRGDDYLTQWLLLLRCIRELTEAGLITVHPHPLGNVPVPPPGTVRRALDVVLPDDHAMVMVIWDRNRIWTGVVLRRRAGSIDLVAGPDLLSRWTGPLGGDFRRDHRVVSDAVARAVAPVHLGLFAQRDTVRELLRAPDAGAWARAVAVRDLIVHPTPPYVAVALGADALRAAARTSARLLGGIDLFGALEPVTQYLRGRVGEITSVTATLGFNPLRVLAAALRRADRPGAEDVEETV